MNPNSPSVLIVDDEPQIRDFLLESLRPSCSLVNVAAGLKEALELMETGLFDIVLTDICMPGASGIDLLDFAKQLNWDCGIILMSGHATLDHVIASVRMQAADFLLKPFTFDSLVNSVHGAYEKLQANRLRRQERESLSNGLRERTHQLEAARIAGLGRRFA